MSRTLVAMLCADGVAVFWLILGFFLFKTQNHLKLCLHTVSRIVIPMLLISIVHFYFGTWLTGNVETLAESFHRHLNDYKSILAAFLLWTPIDGLGHLWYLYVYILAIIIYPAISGMVSFLDKSNKGKKAYLILALLVFAANLLTNNGLMEFSHHTIRGLVPAIIVIIFGHIIYLHRNYLKRYGLYSRSVFCPEYRQNPVIFKWFYSINILVYVFGYNMRDLYSCILYKLSFSYK